MAKHDTEDWNRFRCEITLDDCIFCKIARKEVPSYSVFDDENHIAFLDIRPMNPGHTLVIPRKHDRWVWDVPEAGRYFEIVTRIARALQDSMKTEWIAADIAGMGVAHAHVHLVPRFPHDGHGEIVDGRIVKTIPVEQMKTIAESIRHALANPRRKS